MVVLKYAENPAIRAGFVFMHHSLDALIRSRRPSTPTKRPARSVNANTEWVTNPSYGVSGGDEQDMGAMKVHDTKTKEHLQDVEHDTFEHLTPPQILRATVLLA